MLGAQDGQNRVRQLHRRYDFAMNTSLVEADADDFIFTKIIVISPKYVLVNSMKSRLEVAQINTQHSSQACMLMEVGERREWVWHDSAKDYLISVRK